MANVYTTRQGQTVDLVCLDYYGRTAKVVEAVIEANPGLAGLGVVLPIGTKIVMPEFLAKAQTPRLVSLWD